MASADSKPKPGYTVSLFVSRSTEGYTAKDGYETRNFPPETKELGRVELAGGDLEKLLTKTKSHIDLIEED
ncbi:hypothetical protein SEA_BAJUNIPER_61 [Microbacterium phage BAjuniper]|nr:hypothetical protein SEA_BAJUNIPER_61 [Microbacterium phage BAjuniper]